MVNIVRFAENPTRDVSIMYHRQSEFEKKKCKIKDSFIVLRIFFFFENGTVVMTYEETLKFMVIIIRFVLYYVRLV
jgi:hypothetical protein